MGWRDRVVPAANDTSGWRKKVRPVEEPTPRNYAAYLGQRAAGGVADTLGMMGESLLANQALPGVGPFLLNEARRRKPELVPTGSEAVRNLAERRAGLPTREELAPRNAAERYGGTAAEFVGAGLPMAPAAGANLPAQLANVGIGVGQGLVLEGARDLGLPEPVAAAASMVAPFAPATAAGATRAALGGGTRRMSAALTDAAAIPRPPAGVQPYRPTAAEAGGSDVAAVAERAGSFTLGSRGTVGARTQETNAALQAEAERISREADALGGRTANFTETGRDAGEAIWAGLRDDARAWFQRSHKAAVTADNAAGAAIARASRGQPVLVDTSVIQPRLQQSAARQAEWGTVDPYVNDLAARLNQRGNTLTLEEAVRLRTHLGMLTKWNGAAPGADVALYRGLYGQLSRQIEQGIGRLNSQAATQQWRRANRLWTEHFERVRRYLDPLEGKLAAPEQIADQILALRTPSRAEEIMGMLPEPRRNQVRAFVIQRLGQAKPSGIEGTLAPSADAAFDPVTFATNYNAMRQSGHWEHIFGGKAGTNWQQLRPELDRLVRVVGRVQQTRRSMFNSSGTASSGLPAGQVTGLGGALAATPFVGPTPLLAVLGGMGGVAISSRLMMSPRFVRWLAQNGQLPLTEIVIALTRLQAVIAEESDAETAMEMMDVYDQLEKRAAE